MSDRSLMDALFSTRTEVTGV